MGNTQLRRMSIIELIMSVSDDELLVAIEREALQLIEDSRKLPNIWDAVKPIRKNVSLEQMIKEQNTKPIDYDTFFSLASRIELDEPIDELLSSLTA